MEIIKKKQDSDNSHSRILYQEQQYENDFDTSIVHSMTCSWESNSSLPERYSILRHGFHYQDFDPLINCKWVTDRSNLASSDVWDMQQPTEK